MKDSDSVLTALAGASANHFLIDEKVTGRCHARGLLSKYCAQKSLNARTRGDRCLLLGKAAASLTLANCHSGRTSTMRPCRSAALHKNPGSSEMPNPPTRPCKTPA